MKKSLKILLVVAFMATLLLALTGCGNKLVATKTTDEDGEKVEERIEVSFKNDKVNKVKMTYTLEKEETAESMKAIFTLGMSMTGEKIEGFNVEQKGKKVIIEVDEKAFAEMSEEEAGMSKKELKEELEEQGYKVK